MIDVKLPSFEHIIIFCTDCGKANKKVYVVRLFFLDKELNYL